MWTPGCHGTQGDSFSFAPMCRGGRPNSRIIAARLLFSVSRTGILLYEIRLRPEISGRDYGNHFEVDQVVPAMDPYFQRFRIRRFHDLETPNGLRIDPASVVNDAIGEHAPGVAEAFRDWPEIGLFEMLDDHEQHGHYDAAFFRLDVNRRKMALLHS